MRLKGLAGRIEEGAHERAMVGNMRGPIVEGFVHVLKEGDTDFANWVKDVTINEDKGDLA
jgi:hypothetical protein